jgi:hypothetical protein
MSSYYKPESGKVPLRQGRYAIHTAQRKRRYNDLKGLAATVIDVTPGSGDRAFTIPETMWREYRDGSMSAAGFDVWDEKLTTYFNQLFDKFEISWLKMLNNQDIAFVCTGEKHFSQWTPRSVTARYIVKVLELRGYPSELSQAHQD